MAKGARRSPNSERRCDRCAFRPIHAISPPDPRRPFMFLRPKGVRRTARWPLARECREALTQPRKSLSFKEASGLPTPLGMHVRAVSTYLLVAILLACPAMCRASEVACCPGPEAEECPDEPGHQAPAAPTDAASCICSGTATKADDSHARHVVSPLVVPLPESFDTSIRPVIGAHARRSLPADPDDWLRPTRLHVLLEVHRC
jgi:hypothetical protein